MAQSIPKYSYIRDQKFSDGSYIIGDGHKNGFIQFSFASDIVDSVSTFKSVKKMSSLDLFDAYYNFDFDLHPTAYFGNIKNEMIMRGLLDDYILSLNDYNSDFDYV